jgi:hypothetical protein
MKQYAARISFRRRAVGQPQPYPRGFAIVSGDAAGQRVDEESPRRANDFLGQMFV